MIVLEKMRRDAFWLLDRLKGGKIGQQCLEVAFLNGKENRRKVVEKRSEYLSNILSFATEHIPYYSQIEKGAPLSKFPIVNKSIIRADYASFCNPQLDMNKMFRQETSGSTGMPFVVYQDPLKRLRSTADTIYFSRLAHYNIGNRLYFSRVWEKGSKRSKWTCFKQNWILHDSVNLSEREIKNFVDCLAKDRSTINVLIFASTLTMIAKYVEKYDLRPKTSVRSFITLSESLDLWTKTVIMDRFGAPVLSRYSNQECGIIAQQLDGSDSFLINEASFYIELLNLDSDDPVKDGEMGRIVITDFFNHAMPLIRYDTGDLAKIKHDESDRSFFDEISGRRVDFLLNTSGELLSPYVINSPMHQFPQVIQYQIEQIGKKDYIMRLNVEQSFNEEGLILQTLKSYLGENAIIKFEYVDQVPVMRSGKRKQVINNYKNI